MPSLKLTLTVELDGDPVFSFVRRENVTEAQALNGVQKAGADGAGVYAACPGVIAGKTLQVVALASDQAVNLKLGAVMAADGIINLQPNGLLVVFNASEAGNPAIEINNIGTDAANLTGAWGST